MSRVLFFLAIGIWILAVIAAAEDYNADTFKQKYDLVQTEEEVAALCRDFMLNTTDIDLMRQVQTRWEDVDPEGVRQFSLDQLKTSPNSAIYAYFYGRLAESPAEKIKMGRKAIALDGQWPYGYRLVLTTYMTDLFSGEKGSPDYAELEAMLPDDDKYFQILVDLVPGDGYPLEYLYGRQVFGGDYNAALATLTKAKELESGWASPQEFGNLYARLGQYDRAMTAMTEAVAAEEVSAEEKGDYLAYYYTNALRDAGAIDEVTRYLSDRAEKENDPEVYYDLACVYASGSDLDRASAALQKAVQLGWDRGDHTKGDTDLSGLRDRPEWNGIIAQIEANRESGREKRKVEALAKKVLEDAPDWSLEGRDGNIVKLADLRGQVIILDFWATWCGPCRISMPMIDKFVKEQAPENVRVFSVNVWEKGRKKQVKFMAENNYSMTLLYGNNDLASAYGVTGIPCICVIDKEGKIRYREIGVSDDLPEYLVWWTQDLLN